VQTAVSGLEAEFGDRITATNENATTPEAMAIVEKHGFANHGLVIRSTDGTTVWSQPDHEVKMDEVHQKLREILE